VTEASAIEASAWIGSGNKEAADKAATEAMRDRLNQMDFAGKIVIGEGKKDHSYGLFEGELLGKFVKDPRQKSYDIAVDPIDGTRPTVSSGPEAMSVIAVAEEGSLFSTPEFYMNKLAYGPGIAKVCDLHLTDPLKVTIAKVSKGIGKDISKIMVCILDRPRHEKMISELRSIGVRIKLIQDCDISGAIATCSGESGIDLLYGIGGAPEGVITACAMKCLRGGLQIQVVKKDCTLADPRVYTVDDLVKSHCVFAATGITDGSLLRGVRFFNHALLTHSIFMRSISGTIRWLTVSHGELRKE
jgi:fructose-1,6-bisphosphatase II